MNTNKQHNNDDELSECSVPFSFYNVHADSSASGQAPNLLTSWVNVNSQDVLQNGSSADLISASNLVFPNNQSNELRRVQLGKASSNGIPSNLYFQYCKSQALPASDLYIDPQHFDTNEEQKESKIFSSDVDISSSTSVLYNGGSSMSLNKRKNNSSDQISKIKSTTQPPSHILSVSASYLKSYLFPSYSDKSDEEKKNSCNIDAENSVKTKVLGMWNNVKYDFPGFARSLDMFKIDFYSMLWFTYRRQFPQLPNSIYTTDCGWGCMLRSGQMMIAEALKRLLLPCSWSYSKDLEVHSSEDKIHRRIVTFFIDVPDKMSPFSIHKLVSIGIKLGKNAGDWKAVEDGSKSVEELNRLCIYIAQDCAVYTRDVLDACQVTHCLCSSFRNYNHSNCDNSSTNVSDLTYFSESFCYVNHSGETKSVKLKENVCDMCHDKRTKMCPKCDSWKALILLVPLRLGGEELNPIYYSCISALLAYDLCIGIIGGRPKHSLYFVGCQEEFLIHLDPHLCQDFVSLKNPLFSLSSFHCSSPRKMPMSRMDPSATVGFFCQNKESFLRLVEEIPELVTPIAESSYPLFEFINGHQQEVDRDWVTHINQEDLEAASWENCEILPQDSEEFVFL